MATWEWNVATNEVVWGGFHHELLGLDGNRYEGTFAEVLNAVHLEDRASFEAKLRNTLARKPTTTPSSESSGAGSTFAGCKRWARWFATPRVNRCR